LIAAADQALYAAKKDGKNRYAVHEPAPELAPETASLRSAPEAQHFERHRISKKTAPPKSTRRHDGADAMHCSHRLRRLEAIMKAMLPRILAGARRPVDPGKGGPAYARTTPTIQNIHPDVSL
jgi:hypothetical protein